MVGIGTETARPGRKHSPRTSRRPGRMVLQPGRLPWRKQDGLRNPKHGAMRGSASGRATSTCSTSWARRCGGKARPDEAEAIYRQACHIQPDDFRSLNNLGMALYSQRRMDEAGECFLEAMPIKTRGVSGKNESRRRIVGPGQV